MHYCPMGCVVRHVGVVISSLYYSVAVCVFYSWAYSFMVLSNVAALI